MVKVLRVTQFCGQEVFSSDSEPVAVACAGHWLFLATAKRTVEVHSLNASTTRSEDAHRRFNTISDVLQLAYNEKAECLVALEKMKTRRGHGKIARIYFNWLDGSLAQPARIRLAGSSRRHVQVMQQERLSQKRAGDETKQLEVVELPVVESMACVCCCPITGNVAVGGIGVIRVFALSRGAANWLEFEQFADIRVDVSCARVSICEDYIAAVSKDEVLALKVNISAAGEDASREETVDVGTSEIRDHENLVVCDFTTNVSSMDGFPSQLEIIQLGGIKGQEMRVEKMREPVEILGPVSRMLCFPITIELTRTTVREYLQLFGVDSKVGRQSVGSGDEKRPVVASCVVMLYRKFSGSELGGAIHSLQLLPTFQALSGDIRRVTANSRLPCPLQPPHFLQEVRQLVGMGCFISGPRQGYMYDVLRDTQLVSTYPYTHDTNAAAVGPHFLQAVAATGLETYTVRNFASSVHDVRKRQKNQEGKQNKLEPESLFEQMCPRADVPICLVGMHPFVGLCGVVTLDDHVVLLSKAPEMERSRTDLWSRSISKVLRRNEGAECTEWGVYVLRNASAEQLFRDMMEMADTFKLANPPVYHQLLCEGNLLLRSQLNSAHVHRSVTEREGSQATADSSVTTKHHQVLLTIDEEKEYLALLRQSCIALAEFYCTPAAAYPELAILYYELSDLSLQDVMKRVQDRNDEARTQMSVKDGRTMPSDLVVHGRGLTNYLMSQLLPCEGSQLTVSEDMGSAIIEIFAAVDRDNLSAVLLESRLKDYSREKALDLLYAGFKGQPSMNKKNVSRDILAIAVLHLELCEVDGARKALKSLGIGDLYDVCEEKYCYLVQNGSLSPLGQLICRHETGAFISTMLYMHDKGIMDLDQALQILGVADMQRLHENKYARYYLEAFLCDVTRSKSFTRAMGVLVRLYVQQLKQLASQPTRSSSPVPGAQSYEMKKVAGRGCYPTRPSWLRYLPPLRGSGVRRRSARIRYSGQRPSDKMPGRSRSDHIDFLDLQSQVRRKTSPRPQMTGARSEHQDLINLQSLLCSEYASQSLSQLVLDELAACGQGVLLDVDLSLKVLCLPKVGFKIQALDLLVNSYPDCLVAYSKHVSLDKDQWQHVMSCLLTLCQQEPTQSYDLDAYKACLDHLADELASRDFLALLPSRGTAAFFLPYIQRNCVASLGSTLQQKLINQCSSQSQDKVSPW